jgi:outer membrane protein assembly factor BamB
MKKQFVDLLICMLLFATGMSVAMPTNTNKLSVTINTPSSVDEWPMSYHDAARTSFSTSSGPTEFLVWNKAIGPASISSPVVVNSIVYLLTRDAALHALSASNGAEIWNYTNAGTPVIVNDLIYFNYGSIVYCLYANGTLKMNSSSLGASTFSPLTYANGFIYVSTNNKKVQCLYASNLTLKWSTSTGSGNPSFPTIANDFVYVGTLEPRVYCLFASNGSVRWSRIVGSALQGTYGFAPVVVGDLLYIGGKTSIYRIYCLYTTNGTQKWVTDVYGGFFRFPPAVAYNKIYFGYLNSNDVTSRVLCLDSLNGSTTWEYIVPGESSSFFSSIEVAGGLVYFGTQGNMVYCLDAAGNGDGTTNKIWSHNIGSPISAPQAIVDGFLYVTTQNQSGGSDIFCFGGSNYPPKKPQLSGPNEGLIGISYTFNAVTTDPENDSISYTFTWGDGTSNTTPSFPSGTTAVASHRWTTRGNYQVIVTAKDTYGQPNQSNVHPIAIKAPGLAIGNISGGLLKVNVELINTGDAPATNVQWEITLGGGAIVFTGKNASGVFSSIDSGTSELAIDKPIIGFGLINITIKAHADGISEITKTADGFIFLIFLKVK